MTSTLTPSPPAVHAWLDQPAYQVPKHPAPVDVALYANERPWYTQQNILTEIVDQTLHCDIDPHTMQVINSSVDQQAHQAVSHYPQPNLLEKHYAQYIGVSEQEVLLTAGGDEGLSRIFRAFLAPTYHVIMPIPTFPMLHRYAQWCHAETITMDWLEGEYPYQQVINQVNQSTRLVMVVSPNNPTGLTITASVFETLLQEVNRKNPQCLVVLDGAYIEFADQDMTSLVLKYPHCVMIRTLSKAFGLAGLRAGFILGHATVIKSLRAVGLPYPVSSLSLNIAHQVLNYFQNQPQQWHMIRQQNQQERQWLSQFFRHLGAHVPKSEANFVYVDGVDPLWWRDMLAGQGIGIRIWPQDEKLKQAMRISCPCDSMTFQRVQNALLTCIAPQVLLFDVDGVLVDVSLSYRSAIIQTAAHFGVEIEASEIDLWKSKGQANNDWILTHNIVQAHGVEVSLQAITDRFEYLYQNELWKKETLLAGALHEIKDDLEKLSQRLPLALVTGRPRKDLERFLQHFQLSSYFTASVCMHEAASKPSADPIILALEHLTQHEQRPLTRAWMIGDTPDDVLAARACHDIPTDSVRYSCLPFAVRTQNEVLEQSLWHAGCARILKSWRQWVQLIDQHCLVEDALHPSILPQCHANERQVQ